MVTLAVENCQNDLPLHEQKHRDGEDPDHDQRAAAQDFGHFHDGARNQGELNSGALVEGCQGRHCQQGEDHHGYQRDHQHDGRIYGRVLDLAQHLVGALQGFGTLPERYRQLAGSLRSLYDGHINIIKGFRVVCQGLGDALAIGDAAAHVRDDFAKPFLGRGLSQNLKRVGGVDFGGHHQGEVVGKGGEFALAGRVPDLQAPLFQRLEKRTGALLDRNDLALFPLHLGVNLGLAGRRHQPLGNLLGFVPDGDEVGIENHVALLLAVIGVWTQLGRSSRAKRPAGSR